MGEQTSLHRPLLGRAAVGGRREGSGSWAALSSARREQGRVALVGSPRTAHLHCVDGGALRHAVLLADSGGGAVGAVRRAAR